MLKGLLIGVCAYLMLLLLYLEIGSTIDRFVV